MNSKTETSLSTYFLTSPLQNPRQKYNRKSRRIIKQIRSLSTIDERDLHSTSSSDSSSPNKNVGFRRTDLGNVLEKFLPLFLQTLYKTQQIFSNFLNKIYH